MVLLGVLLSTSQAVAPERLYPWLGAGSGLLFTGIGASMLRRAWHGRRHGHHGHTRTATTRTATTIISTTITGTRRRPSAVSSSPPAAS